MTKTNIKKRIEQLEQEEGPQDHGEQEMIILRWPEDPEVHKSLARGKGPPLKLKPGERIRMTWPDGSEASLP